MKTIKSYILLSIIMLFSTISHAETLQNGVPFQTSLEFMNLNVVEFSVPANSSSIMVTISDSSGDLDLFLKYASPVSGTTVEEIIADADASSTGPTADETITLNASSTPALKAGIWYISVLNWNEYTTSFTLTAIQEESSPQTVDNHSSGAGGIPAGAVILNGNEVSVIGMNFSNDFDMESINEWQTIGMSLLAQLGDQGTITPVPANVLLDAGYNGAQLHELIVSALPGLQTYYQVDVSKISKTKGSSIRLDIYLWNTDYPSGQFAGAIEIADPLPLMNLLSLMSNGSKFIKISTSKSTTAAGDEFNRMEFYFQETATSESVFMASVEITELLMTKAFSLLQVAD